MTPRVVSVKVYAGVFAALLLLLALTVAVALVEHPVLGLAVALTIAGIKATLIALFFMQVRFETPSVRLAAVAGLLWLTLLISLSLSDLLTRSWPPATETPAGQRRASPEPKAGRGPAKGSAGFELQWAMRDSNLRPPACREFWERRTFDTKTTVISGENIENAPVSQLPQTPAFTCKNPEENAELPN